MKKAIRGKSGYASYAEHKMMENYSIGYNELMDFPFEKYMEFSKIMTLEAKEEKKETKRKQKEAKSNL